MGVKSDPRVTSWRYRILRRIVDGVAADGRPPSLYAIAAAIGCTESSAHRAAVRLWQDGYLVRRPNANGTGSYWPTPDCLLRARALGVMPKGAPRWVADAAILTAARRLVAEGRYPSCLAVAEAVGAAHQTVSRRRRKMIAQGRWPQHNISSNNQSIMFSARKAATRRKDREEAAALAAAKSQLRRPRVARTARVVMKGGAA